MVTNKKKKPPPKKKKKKSPQTKSEPFKLNPALSRLSAFCGDVQLRCIISDENAPFYAAAFVGSRYVVGRGKTAGGAIKGLWDGVADIANIETETETETE